MKKNKTIIEFIKNIEHSIKKLPETTQNEIRNCTISTLNNLSSLPFCINSTDKKLNELLKHTNEFLRNNPNIILSRPDKGNVTVALNRVSYIKKKKEMNEMFQDRGTYEKITKDPTNKMINNLRVLLTRWRKSDYIHNNYIHLQTHLL